ncbi:hypothetical protein PINS_up007765 [Pythium insidiosum]|nr:hypothetical protein PINS_up007765 [Pythium insidiosum]
MADTTSSKRQHDEATPSPPASAQATAAAARKRPRRGVRKSKAERLAARAVASSASTAVDAELLAQLDALLAASTTELATTTSEHWDHAQRLAIRVGTLDAKRRLVQTLLFAREAPRAAVHYASRLQLSSTELVALLADGSHEDDARRLLVAKFLADASDALVSNAHRVERLLLPWLTQHAEHERHETVDDVEPTTAGPPPPSSSSSSSSSSSAAVLTAVRLALAAHKHADEKLDAQRALVRRVLSLDTHKTIVLQYAPAFRARLQDIAARLSTRCPERHEDVDTVALGGSNVERELGRRGAIAATVETALRRLWPDARVLVFGSSATGTLALSPSGSSDDDVDLCVLLPSCPERRQATAPIVEDIRDHLSLELGVDALAVSHARIPIARWTDAATALQCDLCVNNGAALWNTLLVRHLLARSPFATQLRRLCVWMKRWLRARRQRIGESLTSYGQQLLVLCYLQRDGLLPRVDAAALAATGAHDAEDDQQERKVIDVERMETSVQQLVAACDWRDCRATCPTLASLIIGFFRFYGTGDFDIEHDVVSLRHPAPTKREKQWSRKSWRFALSIEDPIETARDLGALFSRATLTRFRMALVECVVRIDGAYNESNSESESDCERESRILRLLLSEIDTAT